MTASNPALGHTAGPWVVEEADHMGPTGVYGTDADGRDWTICDMGVPVDLVCEAREDLHPRFVAMQLANAHLVAAAPDMLEALEAVLRLAKAGPDDSYLADAMEAGRAAIFKARGL